MGLSFDKGLTVSIGLVVDSGLSVGDRLTFEGFENNPNPPVDPNALLWGDGNDLLWGDGNTLVWS